MGLAMSDTAKTTLTLKEAAKYLNRSVGFFNKERKATLVEQGATLGGPGVESAIPVEVLDKLGWRAAPKAVTNVSSEQVDGLAEEVAVIEQDLEGTKRRLTDLTATLKEKRAELTKVQRETERAAKREQARAEREATSGKAKRLADAKKEAARLEKAAKRAADKLAMLEADA